MRFLVVVPVTVVVALLGALVALGSSTQAF